jgi:hypothetical protein
VSVVTQLNRTKRDQLKAKMVECLGQLPDPGEASENLPYTVTMFKVSLLTFLETEKLGKLTCVLIGLTSVLAVLTVALIITSLVR